VLTTEEAFSIKIKETISGNYDRETQHLLDHEIQHHYVDHTKNQYAGRFLEDLVKGDRPRPGNR